MNKNAIKTFAIWAREELINKVKLKAKEIGITNKEIVDKLPSSTNDVFFYDVGDKDPVQVPKEVNSKRNQLADKIKVKAESTDYETAYDFIMEEVAYTWFNRLIAIRFMEINDYLPSGYRVLSGESGEQEPSMVTNHNDLDFLTDDEKDMIVDLKLANKDDEVFGYLFIKQCNELNKILPKLFETTNDCFEILFNLSYNDTKGVIYRLVNDIEAKDFKEIEIIGWLYQYYNQAKKDEVYADLKKNKKVTTENIPAATQLFTPQWIVKYMVENSLGRIGVDNFGIDPLKMGWKYYLEEAKQEESVQAELDKLKEEKIEIKEIKIIDPCMGSGHILVYIFDVLVQLYKSGGVGERETPNLILQHNLFGLDIDKRAYQLAYFCILMKCVQYDKRFFTRADIPEPQVYCPLIEEDLINYGSLFKVDIIEPQPTEEQEITLATQHFNDKLNDWNYKRLLHEKYDVVITNPPYLGSAKVNSKLTDYLKKEYKDSKSDLFSAFIEKCNILTKENGLNAMITMHSWMFLSSYENLRLKLKSNDILNMVHLGARAFEEIGGEVVQTTSFVYKKNHIDNYKSTFVRLVDFNSQDEKEKEFLSGNHIYITTLDNFSKIPGSPIAYWVSDDMLNAFAKGILLGSIMPVKKGMDTGDNNKFMRLWFEISLNKFDHTYHSKKWIPYDKGGNYNKWYGNNECVINWENDGKDLKNSKANLRSINLYFKTSITWNALSYSKTCFRYSNYKGSFDSAGSSIFPSDIEIKYILGLMNTNVVEEFLNIINPTLNFGAGSMYKTPLILDENEKPRIDILVQENIEISKTDWDSFETSWDFEIHPLIQDTNLIETAFASWQTDCKNRFDTLKANEETLNEIFIGIYGLGAELTKDVEDKDVTVYTANVKADVKSFISYFVGCLFGRYSLDNTGLIYAGGTFDETQYTKFKPTASNVVLITDDDYVNDDIFTKFKEFVSIVYGATDLNSNLEFIANALADKGDVEVRIRNYFVKDFYKDHVKTYKKCPIYWLYDSGKNHSFKALVYMHRYEETTTGTVRTNYVHKMQTKYKTQKEDAHLTLTTSSSVLDQKNAQKLIDKLNKQEPEIIAYDKQISGLAGSSIAIDLDDGVKVNYEKVQIYNNKNMNILGKI